MPVVTRFPSTHTVVATGWTNPANAFAAEATPAYATCSPGRSASVTSDFGGFNFGIPDRATINSISVEVAWFITTVTTGSTLGAQAVVNGTTSGTEFTNTTATARVVQTFSVPTTTHVWSPGFAIRARYGKGATNTTTTGNLDYVRVTVDYTEFVPDPVTYTGPTAGLVGAWRFKSADATGAQYRDRSGNKQLLTAQTGTTQLANGQGVNLAGGGWLRFDYSAWFPTRDFTLLAVVRPAAPVTGFTGVLTFGPSLGGTAKGGEIGLSDLNTYYGGLVGGGVTSTTSPEPNAVEIVRVRYRASDARAEVWRGQTMVASGITINPDLAPSGRLAVGAFPAGTGTLAGEFYAAAIYQTYLSDADFLAAYNALGAEVEEGGIVDVAEYGGAAPAPAGFVHLDLDAGVLREVAAGSGAFLTLDAGTFKRATGTESAGALILNAGTIRVKL